MEIGKKKGKKWKRNREREKKDRMPKNIFHPDEAIK